MSHRQLIYISMCYLEMQVFFFIFFSFFRKPETLVRMGILW